MGLTHFSSNQQLAPTVITSLSMQGTAVSVTSLFVSLANRPNRLQSFLARIVKLRLKQFQVSIL
jgi:hypothetical protein